MKSLIIACVFTLISSFSTAQILEPVKWEFKVTQNKDTSYTLTATSKMEKNWAIYSQHTGKGGPIALEFVYENEVQLLGETKEESEAIKKMSKMFDMEVIKFENEAIFTQIFKPTKGQTSIKGYVTFMCCDNKRCLPPTDVEFDVAL